MNGYAKVKFVEAGTPVPQRAQDGVGVSRRPVQEDCLQVTTPDGSVLVRYTDVLEAILDDGRWVGKRMSLSIQPVPLIPSKRAQGKARKAARK